VLQDVFYIVPNGRCMVCCASTKIIKMNSV